MISVVYKETKPIHHTKVDYVADYREDLKDLVAGSSEPAIILDKDHIIYGYNENELCYVLDENKTYKFTNGVWVEFGYGDGDTNFYEYLEEDKY